LKKLNESYESQYVILLHKAYYPVSEISKCFKFIHPVKSEDFNQKKNFYYTFERDEIIYGFAGYFDTVLYEDFILSITPSEHTPNMFSWFPIYFPSTVNIIINLETNICQ
jgi:protein arginine N-methyltransferase 5